MTWEFLTQDSEWSWSYCNWSNRIEIPPLFGEQQHQQISHEFRNLPGGFKDWVGHTFEYAMDVMFWARDTHLVSTQIIYDYKSIGSTDENDKWTKLYSGDQDLRLNPHFNQPSQQQLIHKAYRFAFEKELSPKVSVQMRCTQSYRCEIALDLPQFTLQLCQCRPLAQNYPEQVHWHGRWRTIFYFDDWYIKFPLQIKNMRIRMEGNGQKLQGFEFFKNGQTHMFSPNMRQVYVRSISLEDKKPLCLIDHSPRTSGNRDILVQPCIQALEVFDGREVWLIRSKPTLTRWQNDSNKAVKDAGLAFPVISNQDGGKTNIFENWQGRLLHSPSNDKCLGLGSAPFVFSCSNKNVRAIANNVRPELGNNPCNPNLTEPKPFHWLPNTTNPEVTYSLSMSHVNIQAVVVKFNTDPETISLSCYNDLQNRWQEIQQAGVFGESKIELETMQCSQIAIKVDKLGFEKNCLEGQCLILEKVEIISTAKHVIFKECDQTEEKPSNDIVFQQEMANYNYAKILTDQNNQYRSQMEEATDLKKQLMKFKFRLRALKGMKEAFSGDTASFGGPDKMVDYELCENKCESMGSGSNIKTNLEDLLKQRARLVSPTVSGGKIGDSKVMPADSCSIIVSVQPKSSNGFQWIKNKCSGKPSKVQCKFDKGGGSFGYSITNNHDNPISNILKSHSIVKNTDLMKICMDYGFNLAKIKNLNDLKTIALLTLIYGFNYHEEQGILIGYDYACETSSCSGDFYSLDGVTKMNSMAAAFNEATGGAFNPVDGNQLLVLKKGSIFSAAKDDSHVVALPCQTINEEMVQPVGCDAHFPQIGDSVSQRILCLNNCEEQGITVGTSVYHDSSSVCNAMLHSRQQQKLGKQFLSEVKEHKKLNDDYKGSSSNGVTSVGLNQQGKAYSFSIPSQGMCPKDIYKKIFKAQDFIQLIAKSGFQSKTNNKTNLISGIMHSSKLLNKNKLQNKTKEDGNGKQDLKSIGDFMFKIQDNMKQIQDNMKNMNNQISNLNNRFYQSNQLHSKPLNNQNSVKNPNINKINNTGKIETINNHQKTSNLIDLDDEYSTEKISSNNNSKNSSINNHFLSQKLFGEIKENLMKDITNKQNDRNTENLNLKSSISPKDQNQNVVKQHDLLENFDDTNQIEKNIDNSKDITKLQKEGLKKLLRSHISFNKINSENNQRFDNQRTNQKDGENHFSFYRKDKKIELLRSNKNSQVLLQIDGLPELNQKESIINKNPNSIQKYIDYDQVTGMDQNTFEQLKSKYDDSVHNSEVLNLNKKLIDKYNKQYPIFINVPAENENYNLKNLLLNSNLIRKQNKDILRFMETGTKSYKEIQKNFTDGGKEPIDFRSDEESNSSNQYTGQQKVDEMNKYQFYLKNGDESELKYNRVDSREARQKESDMINNAENIWREGKEAVDKGIARDSEKLNVRSPVVDKIIKIYEDLSVVGVASLRLANKLMNLFKVNIRMIEDKTQTLFKYSSMSQQVDLINNSPMMLPQQWYSLNPKYSSLEFATWKQVETSKIKLLNNPKSEQKREPQLDYGNILFTKFHRTFDGSMHFTIKAPSEATNKRKPVFGAFFRQCDQFNHYQLKFDIRNQLVMLAQSTQKEFKIILTQKNDAIKLDSQIRVVVQFIQQNIKIWISVDDGSHQGNLDEDKRMQELEYSGNGSPIIAQDPTFKEGRIGFFSSDAEGLEIKNLLFQSDECIIPDPKEAEKFGQLLSPSSFRQKESYKGSQSFTFETLMVEGTNPAGKFNQGEGPGRQTKVMSNIEKSSNAKQKDQPALWAVQKDKTKICFDECAAKVGFQLKDLESSGNFGFGFKFNNLQKQFAVLIQYEKSTNKFKLLLIKNEKNVEIISKKSINLKKSKWQDLKIQILADKIYVLIENKLYFDRIKIEEFNTLSGKFAFGVNGLNIMFGGFNSTIIKGDPKIPGKNKNDKNLTHESFLIPNDDPDAMKEKALANVALKKDFGSLICKQANTEKKRRNICENDVISSEANTESDKCFHHFCEVCCQLYDSGQSALLCNKECLLSSEKSKVNYEDTFGKCFINPPKLSEHEKLVSCVTCCNLSTNEQIEENIHKLCVKECNDLFKSDFKQPQSGMQGNIDLNSLRVRPTYLAEITYNEIMGIKDEKDKDDNQDDQ